MVGLGVTKKDLAAKQQDQQAPQQAPQQDGQLPDGLVPATDEEQALLEKFVGMAGLTLWQDDAIRAHAKFLSRAPSMEQGIGEVASAVAQRVYANAREEGVEIPGDILFHGGRRVVEEVAEFAQHAGFIGEIDQGMLDNAFFAAADSFGKAMTDMGVYTDEQRAQDIAEIKAMADDGTIDRILQARSQLAGGPKGGA